MLQLFILAITHFPIPVKILFLFPIYGFYLFLLLTIFLVFPMIYFRLAIYIFGVVVIKYFLSPCFVCVCGSLFCLLVMIVISS